MVAFKKAERKKVKLKIALTGPSGSGKTYSGLLIASGIGEKIAVIDTENASASLYADRFDFDTLTIEPPYTINKYIDAIKAAETAGYDVLVVDSLSHAWAGEGGLLSKKESLDQRGGNSYTNWAGITKEHEGFKSTLLNCKIHLVCTMRSKQDYVLETNDKGKQSPKKVGLAPIQRDGMEYEFTTVLDLSAEHSAIASKDRTSLFDGQIFKPTKQTGKLLLDWINEATEEEVAQVVEQKVAPKEALVRSKNDPVVRPGIKCTLDGCDGELVMHPTKVGYLCEKAVKKNDGHLRIAMNDLNKLNQKPQQEISQGA